MSAEIKKTNGSGKCPVMHGALTKADQTPTAWWPNSLNLDILHQHDTKTNPLPDFNYKKEVKKLNFKKLKKDLLKLMDGQSRLVACRFRNTTLVCLFRMAWHSAGTYRIADGRGGSRNW